MSASVGAGLGLRLGLLLRLSGSGDPALLGSTELAGVTPHGLTSLTELAPPLKTWPLPTLLPPAPELAKTRPHLEALSTLSSKCLWSCSTCTSRATSLGKLRRAARRAFGAIAIPSQRVLARTRTLRSAALPGLEPKEPRSFMSQNTAPPEIRSTLCPPTSTDASPRRRINMPRPASGRELRQLPVMSSPDSAHHGIVLPLCTRKLTSSRSQPRNSSKDRMHSTAARLSSATPTVEVGDFSSRNDPGGNIAAGEPRSEEAALPDPGRGSPPDIRPPRPRSRSRPSPSPPETGSRTVQGDATRDASRLARPKLPCRGHPFLPACHASTGTLRVASEGDEPVPARTSQGVPDTRSGSGTSRLRRRLRQRDGLWRAEPQAEPFSSSSAGADRGDSGSGSSARGPGLDGPGSSSALLSSTR